MDNSRYVFIMGLYNMDGKPIDQVPLTHIDWEPSFQYARFEALRGETAQAEDLGLVEISGMEPVWSAGLGEPYLESFRVLLGLNGVPIDAVEVPMKYFESTARQFSGTLVEKGMLKDGEQFLYNVLAYPSSEKEVAPPKRTFQIRVAHTTIPLDETPLAAIAGQSTPFGVQNELDIPVFIPKRVLEETVASTRAAGANEVGGVLIGHLHRDPETRALFAEVTAQIPAVHTRSDQTRLTFTPETWSAFQDEIENRGHSEIYLGWWHSHSYLKEVCGKCEQKDKNCQNHAAFLSQEDRHLHRTVFSAAYNLALVLSDAPCSGLICALYGWREGSLNLRGFNVMNREVQSEDETSSQSSFPITIVEGEEIRNLSEGDISYVQT